MNNDAQKDMDRELLDGPVTGGTAGSLRGFWSLFVTQFQGAFSDNVLKNLVIFLILGLGVSMEEKHRQTELVGALFALPFILFSMAGGYLADRFSKRTISIGVKVFELGVMSVVLAGLLLHQNGLLIGAVFLMGTHSAFFGPSKYGLLPELLPERRLSWGNGLLELGTFVAIILGTVAAAFMSIHFHGHPGYSGIVLVTLAVVGLATSLGITKVPAADPSRKFRPNFVVNLIGQVRGIRGDRPLVLAFIGNTYFTFLGALLLLNLFFYGAYVLKVDDTNIGYLNAALALGIGGGSLAAGYLSGGRIRYGLVPLGAIGLSAASVALGADGLSFRGVMLRLALLGFAGGFFIVPISALLQHRPDKEKKGEVLAAANLLSFVGVFLASAAHYALTELAHISPPADFSSRRRAHPGRRGLCHRAVAGRAAPICPLGRYPDTLSHPGGGARKHSGQGWRALCLQPPLAGGRDVAHRLDGSGSAVHHLQRDLRAALD